MGALFAIDGTGTGNVTTSKELWIAPTRMIGRAAPLFVNERLYAIDDSATMLVFDPKTGKEIGKQKLGGNEAFSSPLYADGKIYYTVRSGIAGVLELNEKGVGVPHRVRLTGELLHGSPIVSHGRIYIPSSEALYCIGNKDQAPVPAEPRPTPTPETASRDDPKPAQLQITPVESLLRPKTAESTGLAQTLSFRLFNANGRYLETKAIKPTYELKGPGKIEPSKVPGKENQIVFTPAPDSGHAVSFVTAKVGELSSTARIRTVPDFPWSVDFSDGKIPETWIGSAYRHIVLDDDLLNSLKTKDPRAARLYIYLVTNFTNANAPTVKFQDAGPRQAWTDLLRYFDLTGEGKPATIDEAKKQFDAGLDVLAKEKVIEKVWDWSDDGSSTGGLGLAVNRGSSGDHGQRRHVQDQHDP